MPVLIEESQTIPDVETHFRTEQANPHDEVWDGAPVAMSPPNDSHQLFVTQLSAIIFFIYNFRSPPHIRAGVNVSDRIKGWKDNYRCPDVAVFMESNTAINCDTHWCGGPDFLVEVGSPRDPTREKLPFYASINSGEVLVIDRYPWQLELYQLQDGSLVLMGTSSLAEPDVLNSSV